MVVETFFRDISRQGLEPQPGLTPTNPDRWGPTRSAATNEERWTSYDFRRSSRTPEQPWGIQRDTDKALP
jgi:hypothetical protein